MKNVFLIGDSIRFGTSSPESLGYGVFVKEKLKNFANVYYPNENCRFVQYTLRGLYDWAKCGEFSAHDIDLVHWNNGLWDVLRLDEDEPLTPLNVYVNMLERVYKKIKLYFSNAKIIFALSTPIVEEENKDKSFIRYNKEIQLYNNAAKALMEKLGVEINDLYKIAKDFGNQYRFDCVHFNNKGCELLADKVVEEIKKHL